MKCKELNIELCYGCSLKPKPSKTCWIEYYKYLADNLPKIQLKDFFISISYDPTCVKSFLKTMELYYPEYKDMANKILILR